MKKGTLLSIALVGLLGFGVASCDSTSVPTSVAPTTSEATAKYTSVAITNKDDLSAEWHVGEANRQVAIESSPALNVNEALKSGELTITSSNTNIVGVIGSMLVANGVGTATVTISLDNGLGTKLTDTVNLTIAAVTPLRRESKTIAEMVKIISAQDDKVIYKDALYTVSGYALNVVDSKYGNFDLYDETGKNMLTVYGASTTASCIVVEKIGDVEASASFVNPKDFKGKDEKGETAVKDGDFVTMTVVTEKYGSKNEVMGHISNIVKAGTDDAKKTLKATINVSQGGTATLSKTSGIYLGEELTVTVAPEDGKVVDSVVANGKTLTPVKGSNNTYKFLASFTNKVTVSFMGADVQRTKLTTSSLGIGEEEVEVEKVVDKITWVSHNINDSRGDFKINKGDYLYNKTATPTAIKQVMLNYNSNNHANENLFKVTFSTEANCAGTKEEVFISTAEGVTSYVAAPAADSDYKFVTIAYAYEEYNNYINNIAVDYTKPATIDEENAYNTTTLDFVASKNGVVEGSLKWEDNTVKGTPDETSKETTINGAKYGYKNCRGKTDYNDSTKNYLMLYCCKLNSDGSVWSDPYFFNKDATATNIHSVKVTFTSGTGATTTPNFFASFGEAALDAHNPNGIGTVVTKGATVTFTVPQGTNAKFFNLSAKSKNVQIAKIEILTVKAA